MPGRYAAADLGPRHVCDAEGQGLRRPINELENHKRSVGNHSIDGWRGPAACQLAVALRATDNSFRLRPPQRRFLLSASAAEIQGSRQVVAMVLRLTSAARVRFLAAIKPARTERGTSKPEHRRRPSMSRSGSARCRRTRVAADWRDARVCREGIAGEAVLVGARSRA
jgi:hypothetical protein